MHREQASATSAVVSGECEEKINMLTRVVKKGKNQALRSWGFPRAWLNVDVAAAVTDDCVKTGLSVQYYVLSSPLFTRISVKHLLLEKNNLD